MQRRVTIGLWDTHLKIGDGLIVWQVLFRSVFAPLYSCVFTSSEPSALECAHVKNCVIDSDSWHVCILFYVNSRSCVCCQVMYATTTKGFVFAPGTTEVLSLPEVEKKGVCFFMYFMRLGFIYSIEPSAMDSCRFS